MHCCATMCPLQFVRNFPTDCFDFDGDETRAMCAVNEKGFSSFKRRPKQEIFIVQSVLQLLEHCSIWDVTNVTVVDVSIDSNRFWKESGNRSSLLELVAKLECKWKSSKFSTAAKKKDFEKICDWFGLKWSFMISKWIIRRKKKLISFRITFALIPATSATKFSLIRSCDVQCTTLDMCIEKKSLASMLRSSWRFMYVRDGNRDKENTTWTVEQRKNNNNNFGRWTGGVPCARPTNGWNARMNDDGDIDDDYDDIYWGHRLVSQLLHCF